MRVLVTYATRHGATRGIAERVAARLREHDLDVALSATADAPTPDGFDAVVVGGAAYMGHWLTDSRSYVERHREALLSRPTWLFSSGPIGTETTDAKGRDLLETSRPLEADELVSSVRAREWHVFYGSYDPSEPPVGVVERLGSLFTRIPAIRDAMPAGDFRDWPAIDAWADEIADVLGARQVGEALAAPHA